MTEGPPRERRDRRALSHVGGAVELRGPDTTLGPALAHALDVTPDEEATRAHVHGFHSYPARLHPFTARRLVEALAAPGATVLDPFCGSGTVLVEARLAGRRAIGTDANPLAVELAWLKVRGSSATERAALSRAADQVAEAAEARRLARAGATHRYPPDDVELFDPHVLLELDGLRAAIGQCEGRATANTLALVLSSILVKVSRKGGDTGLDQGPRRLASGSTIRLFRAKASELASRLHAFADALPPLAPEPAVHLADARALPLDDGSVDAVITSPPYPGNYDYLAHHAVRLRWLGMPAEGFDRAEIGARRRLDPLGPEAAVAAWRREFGDVLGELARVLVPRGAAAIVTADTVVAGRPLDAAALLVALAPTCGFEVAAIASQPRPHFHAPTSRAFDRMPRREHVVIVRRPRVRTGARRLAR